MEKKKVYKIRNKETGDFLYLGYNSKHSWSVYPSSAIAYSQEISKNKEKYEVVVFEYELKETTVMELK